MEPDLFASHEICQFISMHFVRCQVSQQFTLGIWKTEPVFVYGSRLDMEAILGHIYNDFCAGFGSG